MGSKGARLAVTLAIGAAGAWLTTQLGVPAPWLIGAMLAVAAAVAAGVPVLVPEPARLAAFILLGASIGAAVTPETLDLAARWPGSFLVLGLSIVATILVGSAYLTRVRGWERTTARYCAMPGAMSQVVAMALRSRADLPRIVFAQSLRVFLLVALMPWLLPAAAGGTAAAAPVHHLAPGGIVVVLATCVAVGLALERLRLPGGALLGAMLASATLHGSGLVDGQLPDWLQFVGYVATGCVIGVRFSGVSVVAFRGTLRGALESIAILLALSAAFAWAGQRLLGLPFGQLWLAYAPGGVEAMTILAFALGFDPAFVGAHHAARILALNLVVPFWLRERPLPPAPERQPAED